MWLSQAEAEGLTLVEADNRTGYYGVYHAHPGHLKPYKAEVRRNGKQVILGNFATAEEAALCIARSPEGQEAAKHAAAAAPLTSEEARQQAEAEGLTLLKADNKTGYLGVYLHKFGNPKPYLAQLKRSGKPVSLGHFATAEEAALCVARSPEGRAAAQKASASEEGNATAMMFSKGGFQGARGGYAHSRMGDSFFVENVMEELDMNNEFYYDKATSTLYYYADEAPAADAVVAATKYKTPSISMHRTQAPSTGNR